MTNSEKLAAVLFVILAGLVTLVTGNRIITGPCMEYIVFNGGVGGGGWLICIAVSIS